MKNLGVPCKFDNSLNYFQIFSKNKLLTPSINPMLKLVLMTDSKSSCLKATYNEYNVRVLTKITNKKSIDS